MLLILRMVMENTNISRGAESAAMAAANAKTRQYEAYLENVANPIPGPPPKPTDPVFGPVFLQSNFEPDSIFNDMSVHQDLYDF